MKPGTVSKAISTKTQSAHGRWRITLNSHFFVKYSLWWLAILTKERNHLTSGYYQSKGVGQPFLLGTRGMSLPEGFPPHSQDPIPFSFILISYGLTNQNSNSLILRAGKRKPLQCRWILNDWGFAWGAPAGSTSKTAAWSCCQGPHTGGG